MKQDAFQAALAGGRGGVGECKDTLVFTRVGTANATSLVTRFFILDRFLAMWHKETVMKKLCLALVLLTGISSAWAAGSAVQLGTFREADYAHRMVANAALVGVPASVKETKAADGTPMYHVRTPRMERQQAEQTVERLRKNQIDDCLILDN